MIMMVAMIIMVILMMIMRKMSKSFCFCSVIGICQCRIMECICAMVLSIVLRTIATTLAKAPGPVAGRNEKSRVLPE